MENDDEMSQAIFHRNLEGEKRQRDLMTYSQREQREHQSDGRMANGYKYVVGVTMATTVATVT